MLQELFVGIALGLLASRVEASCHHCVGGQFEYPHCCYYPGKDEQGYTYPCDPEKVERSRCCDKAMQNTKYEGLTIGSGGGDWRHPNYAYTSLGSGNIIPSASSCACPKFDLHGANASMKEPQGHQCKHYLQLPQRFIPNLLGDGRTDGKHHQFQLGRPGRCAANVFVDHVGDLLAMPTGQTAVSNATSVGACCDRCSDNVGCVAWSMSGLTCSLLGSVSGKMVECEACFSGLDITKSQKVLSV